MLMHKKILAFVVLALLATALSGCKLQTSIDDPSAIGKLDKPGKVEPAPTFSGELLTGKKVSLADYRGKPLVINFWASWCPPCRSEQPEFVKVHKEFGDQVEFLGINFRDSEAPANKYVRDFQVKYESIFDPSGRIGFKFGVKALPATFFVDAEGRIVRRKFGGVSKKDLREGVESLVAKDKNAG